MKAKRREMVAVIDEAGNESLVPLERWKREQLEPGVRQDWNNPERMHDWLFRCLENDLYEEMPLLADRLLALEGWTDRALIFYVASRSKTGRVADAEAACNRRLAKNPADPLALGLLGKMHENAGRISEAMALLWKALEANPNHLVNAEQWIRHHQAISDQAAEDAAERLAALPGSWVGSFWLQRKALEAGKIEESLALYRQILDASGRSLDALTVISGELGGTGYAREMLELLLPIYDPLRHGPIVAHNLLLACWETKDLRAAERLRDQLSAVLPDSSVPTPAALFESRLSGRFNSAIESN